MEVVTISSEGRNNYEDDVVKINFDDKDDYEYSEKEACLDETDSNDPMITTTKGTKGKKKRGRCCKCGKMKWVVLVLVALAGFFVCDYVFGFTGMGNTGSSNGEQPEIEFEMPDMDIIEETEVEVVEVIVVDPNPEPVNPNPTIPAEVDTTNQNGTAETDSDIDGVDSTDVETGTQAAETDVEETEAPVVVPFKLHPHMMKDLKNVYLTAEYPVPVDQLYNDINGDDTAIFRQWFEEHNVFDLVFEDWVAGTDKYTGHNLRKFDYKLKIDNVFVPSGHATVHVKQVAYGQSQEGIRYVVDSFYQNEGVPYSETFFTVVRFALRATSHTTSEIRISCEIRYHKEPWGFIKNLIEGPAYAEIKANYHDLGIQLTNLYSG